MRSIVDQRVIFFLGAAVVCALLAPVAPGFVTVCLITAAVYVLLAVLSALDRWSRSRQDGR